MILNKGEIWRSQKAKKGWLVMKTGRLWVTQSSDLVDRILEPGDALKLDGKDWVGQALGGFPCDFTISTFSQTEPTQAIPSRSSSRRAG